MTMNFLVVGSTGKTGRRVADRPRERGEHVRITSRRRSPGAPAGPGRRRSPASTSVDVRDIADADAEIAAAFGRDVRYVPVPAGRFAAAAASQSVPEEEVDAPAELFVRVLDERNESVTRDVARVLGRPATDFAEFAREAAATGVRTR
ncbi:hypothetical protein ACWED2_23985 [Amycolatopsis sp. NPDC005003]